MNLTEFQGKFCFVQKRSIRDLNIFDALFFIFPCNPKKEILIESICTIAVICAILPHFFGIGIYFAIRDSFKVNTTEGILGRNPFCKNVSIQVYFFQICKYCLTVFGNGERVSDAPDVIGGILQVSQDQICKIDKSIVINSAFSMKTG